MSARQELDRLIKKSGGNLTQKTFNGWKGAVINFLLRESPSDVEGFKEVCGTEVHQIAPARQFLVNLRSKIS